MKKNLLICFLIIQSVLIYAQPKKAPVKPVQSKIEQSLFFMTAKSDLTDSSILTLKDLAVKIKQKSNNYKIYIKGNTDNVGDSAYNIQLSSKRALVVKEYMRMLGLEDSVFTLNSLGENSPLADNETEEGKQRNRRVEIVVNYTPKKFGPVTFPLCGGVTSVTKCCINPSRDTVLMSKKGKLLFISKGSFQGNCRGAKGGCLEIEIKETDDKSEMLCQQLFTRSGTNLLSSSGMIYINATCNGTPAPLKNKKTIGVAIPLIEKMEDSTQLFRGDIGKVGTPINWVAYNPSVKYIDANNFESWAKDDCKDPHQADERCRLFFCGIKRWLGFGKKKQDMEPKPDCNDQVAKVGDDVKNTLAGNYNAKNDNVQLIFAGAGWKNLVNDKLKDFNAQLKNGEAGAFDAALYAFSGVKNLGWTNWDAYMRSNNKVPLALKSKPESYISYNVVMKKTKCVMPQVMEGKDFFKDAILPKGEQATVVAFMTEDGKLMMAYKPITISADPIDLEFKPYTTEELKAKMTEIGL